MKLALGHTPGSMAISTINHPSPHVVYGPGLPIGGDYGTILAYFVNRARPTYGFFGLPPSMAVVGVEAFSLDFVVLAPVVYLFLDQSMVAESWYYVYRYLYGTAMDKLSPPASTGPVSGSPGPLTLISSNVIVQPNNGFFSPCMLPKSSGAMPLQGVGRCRYQRSPNRWATRCWFKSAWVTHRSSAYRAPGDARVQALCANIDETVGLVNFIWAQMAMPKSNHYPGVRLRERRPSTRRRAGDVDLEGRRPANLLNPEAWG